MKAKNFVSMGRNPNHQLTCGFPRCASFQPDPNPAMSGGWCRHPTNRAEPSAAWPTGFTPSVASDGGCDLHTDAPILSAEQREKAEGWAAVEAFLKEKP